MPSTGIFDRLNGRVMISTYTQFIMKRYAFNIQGKCVYEAVFEALLRSFKRMNTSAYDDSANSL